MAKKLFLDYFCPKNAFEDWLEPLTHLEDHDLEPLTHLVVLNLEPLTQLEALNLDPLTLSQRPVAQGFQLQNQFCHLLDQSEQSR